MILSGIKTLLESGEMLTTPGGDYAPLDRRRHPASARSPLIAKNPHHGRNVNMPKLVVYNSMSLDGYFTDADGDMSWAHKRDPEWQAFISENARGWRPASVRPNNL